MREARVNRRAFRHSRPAVWIMSLALLGGAALSGCGGGESTSGADAPAGEPAPAAERSLPVSTSVPAVEDVADRVSLPAELLPYRRAVLAAEVGGVVEAVSFDAGQRVSRGKILVSIDTRSLAQAVAEAEAVDRQRQLQFQRAERLFEKRSITQQQMLDAVTNRDVAASRLASAKLELSKSRVSAPWTGTIAERRVEVGDFVSPGQPIATLVEVRRIKVTAPVPANDVPLLEVGAEIQVKVDALAGDPASGRITRMAPEVDPLSRTLEVEAEIDNPLGALRPGMPARLELDRRTLVDALLVPLSAVVDLGEVDGLFVVRDGRAESREVTLGPVVGNRVVIASGLAAGERVVVSGARQLVPGQLVAESPVDAEAGAAAGAGETMPPDAS